MQRPTGACRVARSIFLMSSGGGEGEAGGVGQERALCHTKQCTSGERGLQKGSRQDGDMTRFSF